MSKIGSISELIVMLKSRIEECGNSLGLRAFVFLGNIAGVFPCKYVNKRVKSGGPINRCYVILLFAIRIYVSTDEKPPVFSPKKDIIIRAVWNLALITEFLSIIIDFFISTFLRNRFVKLFEKLAMYDQRVAELGHPHRDRYSLYWFSIGVMCLLAHRAIRSFETTEWTTFAWLVVKFVSVPLIFRLSVLRFDLLVHLVYQRFRHLNKSILPIVSWTRRFSPENLNSVTASDVVFLHATLLEASTIINDTFSFMLLCAFPNFFFTSILHTYRMYLLGSDSPFNNVPTFVIIYATCAVCHFTAQEGNDARKCMLKDEPTLVEDSTAMDRIRMQLYLMHNRVIFSGGEMFAINLPIFYSMVIAIVSYGVLLTKSVKIHATPTTTNDG